MDIQALQLKAAQMRLATWQMIYRAKTGHTGSDLSCADIVTALYNDVMQQTPATFTNPNRDRYVQSKAMLSKFYITFWRMLGIFLKQICSPTRNSIHLISAIPPTTSMALK